MLHSCYTTLQFQTRQNMLRLLTLPEALLTTRKLKKWNALLLHLDIVTWHFRRDNVAVLDGRRVDVVFVEGIDIFE